MPAFFSPRTSMIDPTFRIAAPPVDMALTALDQMIVGRITVVNAVVILAAIIFALREWSRSQSPIPLLLILGGAFTSFMEPFVDLGGGCWHPIIGQHELFENMARPIPVWLGCTYVAYFGVLPMVMYYFFAKGITTRAMWLWFLVPVVVDIILEETLLSQADHLYAYYGNQPLKLHVFPLWWTASNTIGVYLSAVVTTLFASRPRSWRLLLVPFCTLLCYGAATGSVGWPSIVVINSNCSNLVTQLGGLASFLIAFAVVYGCTQLIAADSRHKLSLNR